MIKARKKYFKNAHLNNTSTSYVIHRAKLAFKAGFKAGELAEWERLVVTKENPKRNPKVTCGSDVNML